MEKEQITKILSKIKDTVGENNYKLALAITGHRAGKIKDIIMCSKDGELLLEYVKQLEQQCKKQKEQFEYIMSKRVDYQGQKKEFIKYLEDEKDRLIKETSHYYIDSFDRQHSVNETIYDEVDMILQKYKEIIGVSNEKK